EETMEGTSPFTAFGGGIENCLTDWTFSFPTNPAFQGNKAVRFEIRKDQPLVGSSERVRSEVTIIRGSEWPGFTKNAWYSFAIYFPTVGFEPDDTRDCINQWFEDGSDETTIRAQSDKAFLEVTPASGSSTLKKYDLFAASLGAAGSVATDGPSTFQKISKDKWHEFVFHIVHSTGSDGLIEVWRDGVKIHNIVGRNMHLKLPKWKIGLYKSSFLDKSSSRYSRVLHFDNVRVGNANATLADMRSALPTTTPTTPTTDTVVVTPPTTPTTDTTTTTTTTPPPTTTTGTQQVVSYTLVNADTDKDIMTIAPGAAISIAKAGTNKFSIRANMANGTSCVVKMVLSGSKSQTRYDD
ncbi:polysaccharide lyase, partial [Paraflavisolibacter sp. H34]|uniref:polysaccharide lyase n=1 Tax=Huijunlia imazamoxiresistens TaxID=3127457 RepID=UPI003019C48F